MAVVCCLLSVIGVAGQTEGYNPNNPPEPQLRLQLTVGVEPADAGYAYGGGTYAEGTRVSVAKGWLHL